MKTSIKDSPSMLESGRSFFRSHLRTPISKLLGDDFSLSIAAPQGNLNYTYSVFIRGSSSPVAILKVKNRSEFEHPLTRKLATPYEKERAVLKRCANAELPVPAVLSDVLHISEKFKGNGPFVCLLQQFVTGKNGREIAPIGSKKELPFLKLVGSAARQIHTISFRGFGDVVSSKGSFTKSWPAYIEKFSRYVVRASNGALDDKSYAVLTERIDELTRRRGPATLIHADMHLANMLFDPTTQKLTAVIDWERSRSSRPSEEFARILYENFVLGQRYSVSEIQEIVSGSGITAQFGNFISGYGLSIAEYESSWRKETETFLMLLCGGFWLKWELEHKYIRPDWERPAKYAKTVVRGIIDKG